MTMSLPDTTEYWWDVKSSNKRLPFVHIKGLDCGHYHVIETEKLYQVDCHACKKHIESDESLKALMEEQKNYGERKRQQKVRKKWKDTYPNNPDCPKCGFVMVKRKNGKTGESFWGCCQYPKCKSVKPYSS